ALPCAKTPAGIWGILDHRPYSPLNPKCMEAGELWRFCNTNPPGRSARFRRHSQMQTSAGMSSPIKLRLQNQLDVRSVPAESDLPVTVLERRPGWHLVSLSEMWRYRELLYFLTWRDIKVRYKQTVLGVGWSVAKPFLTVMVFSFFLGRRLAVHEGTLGDYILIAFTGFLPWMFFSTSFASAAHSIVGGHELVTRVYFPRLLLPIASIGANFLDFAIGFLLLLVVMFCYGIQLGWGILLVPVIVVFLLAATLGVGTLLA